MLVPERRDYHCVQTCRLPAVQPGSREPVGAAAFLSPTLWSSQHATGHGPDDWDADHIWAANCCRAGLWYIYHVDSVCCVKQTCLLFLLLFLLSLQHQLTVPKLLPVQPTQLHLRPPTLMHRRPFPPPHSHRLAPVLLLSNITVARLLPPSSPSALLSPRLHSSSSPPLWRLLQPRSSPSHLLLTVPCLRPVRLLQQRSSSSRSLNPSLPSPQHLHLSARLPSCRAHPLLLKGLSHLEHPLPPLNLDLAPLLLRFLLAITPAKCRPLLPSRRPTTQAPHLPAVICPLLPWLRATTCLQAHRGCRACLGPCSSLR